jgi:hypothetical protein
LKIIESLGDQQDTIIVGGQAINIWAEYYSGTIDIAHYGPFTSKDIDYFGKRRTAALLANSLNGTLAIPTLDDVTPESAIVTATIGETTVEIDFLSNILGVAENDLKKRALVLSIPVSNQANCQDVAIRVMHPLHCLQSRVANFIVLGRHDAATIRQLKVAQMVLTSYIHELLALGRIKDAKITLKELFRYLKSNQNAKLAQLEKGYDFGSIIRLFCEDERLDDQYRDRTLRPMLKKLGDVARIDHRL